MRIASWNVNGIRACLRKGYRDWVPRARLGLLALQEVRASLEDIPPQSVPTGWHASFVAAEKKGYSGVGLLAPEAPDELEEALGIPEYDIEGRYQLARYGSWWVCNCYFPNGSGSNRDHSRIPYKFGFYEAVFDRLELLRRDGEKVLVLGDYNTAHTEIDLARPKSNHKTSGFTPEERQHLSEIFGRGWVDTYRQRHPGAEGAYSWWSQRGTCRERNVGWRIDYVLASPSADAFVEEAFILPQVIGSDHCPVGVRLSGTWP